MQSPIHGLYVITPDTDDRESLHRQVGLALRGGASVVQFRNKGHDHARRLQCARMLKTLCGDYGATLIINDDVELARRVDADGVHVGRKDMALQAARTALPDKLVGVSCYNDFELALHAQALGADYVAFGRFFASKTKPHAVQAGLDLLERARTELHVPTVAIGGVTPQNAGRLVKAGADAVAVVDAVFAAADIQAAARQIAVLF